MTTIYLLVKLILWYKINSLLAGTYLALAYLFCECFSYPWAEWRQKHASSWAACQHSLGFCWSLHLRICTSLHNWVSATKDLLCLPLDSILPSNELTSSAMQIFVMQQFSPMISRKLGRYGESCVLFRGRGVLYHYNGVGDLAALGAFIVSPQIVYLIILFLVLDTFRRSIE